MFNVFCEIAKESWQTKRRTLCKIYTIWEIFVFFSSLPSLTRLFLLESNTKRKSWKSANNLLPSKSSIYQYQYYHITLLTYYEIIYSLVLISMPVLCSVLIIWNLIYWSLNGVFESFNCFKLWQVFKFQWTPQSFYFEKFPEQ